MKAIDQYKIDLEKYYNDCKLIKSKLESDIENSWNEIKQEANDRDEENQRYAKMKNDAKCVSCGNKEYIIKYRDVIGEIHGKTQGNFSFFGGSISGYVNGNVDTLPILSCKNCGNEKRVELWDYTYAMDLLKDEFPTVYRSLNDYSEAGDWLKDKGLEIAIGLIKYAGYLGDKQDIRKFSEEELRKCGLVRKIKFPTPPQKPSILTRIKDYVYTR